ncbi:MAG: hypothetical protein EXQ94_01575 [Alphaproteobacteria bacterium]|nr:hypothetical protein [Alphaproteobacteria bacterium]
MVLDERDAYVHALVGWFYLFRGDHDAAMRHTERAVTLNANDVTSMWCRGGTLAYVGRAGEGLGWLEKALRVDPFGWSERWSEIFVESLYMAKAYEPCVTAFLRMQSPTSYEFATLAASYAQLGRLEEARSALKEFERRRPPYLTADALTRSISKMCRYPEDRNHWLDGFRKAGLIA